MRIVVTGGRHYADAEHVDRILTEINPGHITQGGATGADYLAKEWAKAHGVPFGTFWPNWDKYGDAAGPKRNELMLRIDKPDLVVAFPGDRGTASCVRIARENGIPVREV